LFFRWGLEKALPGLGWNHNPPVSASSEIVLKQFITILTFSQFYFH
jgi:hypothetical protein